MRLKRWLVVVAICFGMVVVFGFIKFMQIRAAIAFGESFPEPSETVETQVTEASDWQARVSVVGELKASRALSLRNEVEGIVRTVGFVAGAKVKAGDVLLQLDISEEQARLAAIEPEIELARLDVERLSGLASKKAVSRQEADRAAAQLAIAKAQAASVKEVIANKTIIAPFDGVTGLHDLDAGEFLPANTLITNLVGNLETLWVDFSLPQRNADLVAGTGVLVTSPDNNGTIVTARVEAVEPLISKESRNLKARAMLSNSASTLKPGTFVRVSVPIGDTRSVIRVSSKAVRINTFGSFVFVLNKDDKNQWRASRRPVTVIAKDGSDSIIADGLQTGETVATTGSFKLREGLLVYVSKNPSENQTSPNAPSNADLPAAPAAEQNNEPELNADTPPQTTVPAEQDNSEPVEAIENITEESDNGS